MQFLEDLVVSGSINEQALTHISLNTGRFRVIQLLKIIARSDCNVLLICLRTYHISHTLIYSSCLSRLSCCLATNTMTVNGIPRILMMPGLVRWPVNEL